LLTAQPIFVKPKMQASHTRKTRTFGMQPLSPDFLNRLIFLPLLSKIYDEYVMTMGIMRIGYEFKVIRTKSFSKKIAIRKKVRT
jgi:hypothetical protein